MPTAPVIDIHTREPLPWAITDDPPLSFAIFAGCSTSTGPLTQEQTADYLSDIQQAILDAGGSIHTLANGYGLWEGISEPSLVFAGSIPPNRTDHLRHFLRFVSTAYHQDAIGLLIHDHQTYPRSYITPQEEN